MQINYIFRAHYTVTAKDNGFIPIDMWQVIYVVICKIFFKENSPVRSFHHK